MPTSTNPLALIVGGSSGIGKQTAKRLLRRGTEVMLLAHNQNRLEKARAELAADGTVQTAAVDLQDERQVDRFRAQLEEEARHVKYLVNAAGTFNPTPFLEHTKSDYAKHLDLNKSFFFITQAVARNMKTHGGGAIVNIGSMWAKQAIKATPSSAYSMAKAGLHSLTQHLAMETGRIQHPRQRGFAGRCRDPYLRRVYRSRQNRGNPGRVQRVSSHRPGGPRG